MESRALSGEYQQADAVFISAGGARNAGVKPVPHKSASTMTLYVTAAIECVLEDILAFCGTSREAAKPEGGTK